MKTAISLPDELFRKAELSATKLRVSRSQLYAQALREFLERDGPESVTARLNQVYLQQRGHMDANLQRAAIEGVERRLGVSGRNFHRGEIWWADLPEPRASEPGLPPPGVGHTIQWF